MSKGFDYSKWDNIELSDDEDDVHPNIDRESWFRMKHRSRVEREDHEDKDKKRITGEMDKANQRIKMLERDLKKISKRKLDDDSDDDDDDDDDDLDDTEAIKIEIEELRQQISQRQVTLDEYEKNKTWNVDNMSEIVEERTMSNTDPTEVDSDPNFLYTYHEFTEKYANLCEKFMFLTNFEESKDFLLKHGTILLQEHAANYLLLATLEDEMNDKHDEMKQRAKQSQLVTNIAELAQSWNTHPGNSIIPFFNRLEQREFLEGFLSGVNVFIEKIQKRAVVKRKEMDAQREEQEQGGSRVKKEGVDLTDIPKEERLGPGGLDPLEVIESLPQSMQDAFESRDTDNLRAALRNMDPKDAEYHMKRCVDSGLWNAE
ncbi:Hsp90 co-chaperone CDC37 [Fragilariopsis cylindrus CCMP1102]|uniref:Hsp90 chaperone protein kinase-targeting subunit n=1 Tax=Fragilariopsis cylindrus CCMP1102 TaxID=635003 RepID=A0A1E7FX85_9STRA|nr:Hsp90 co-chaperone CDC37 [Fragilariopsis cylindrus CCMP1102]|eukprot:OEU22768.1 Hsp90 co-chaperone CDC37 [Fragilariopsis cylindrus CCMP1102]